MSGGNSRRPYVLLSLAAVVALVAFGCAGTYGGGRRATPAVVREVERDGVRLTATLGTWDFEPSDLERSFLPVEVTIENRRGEDVYLDLTDFFLFDERGTQVQAVEPEDVDHFFYGERERPPRAVTPTSLSFSLGYYSFYGHYGPYPYFRRPFLLFRPHYHFYGYPPEPYYRRHYLRGPEDLLRVGLRQGRIRPGATVRGFVFFQRPIREPQELTLEWTAYDRERRQGTVLSVRFY